MATAMVKMRVRVQETSGEKRRDCFEQSRVQGGSPRILKKEVKADCQGVRLKKPFVKLLARRSAE